VKATDSHAYRRQRMVEVLRQGGITNERLLAAMAEVPRHLFVPASYRNQAYSEDVSINIGEGQTISQPRVMALMKAAASARGRCEIGTGSATRPCWRNSPLRLLVERIPSLARSAKQRLDSLGLENVSVKVMDGTLGWSAQAPFDAILVTAAAPEFPQPLLEQLADGGRLVIPVGSLDSQALWVAERHGNRASRAQLQNACFVPLIGRHGWQEGS
jgi:protein-L-isoaspartate(D-aspartate) O-methyltransferase